MTGTGSTTLDPINTITSGDQSPPKTVVLNDGRILHIWADCATSDDTTSMELQGRIFNADGTPSTAQFSLSSMWAIDGYDGYDWDNLDVDVLNNGNVVVSYVRNTAEGFLAYDEPVFSILNPTVTPNTAGFYVKTNVEVQSNDTTTYESPPVTTVLNNGNILFVWSKNGASDDTTSMDLRARIFDQNGNATGAEFSAGGWAVDGSDGFDVSNMTVTKLANGNVVIGYVRSAAEFGFGTDEPVYTVMNQNGTIIAQNLEMQQTDTGSVESPPVITALADGRWMAVWSKEGLSDDTNAMTLQGRIFNADGTPASSEFRVGQTAVDGTDFYDTENFNITTLPNGRVVVGYVETGVDCIENPTFTIINTNLAPGQAGFTVASDVKINSLSTANDANLGAPVIEALGDTGTFVAVWRDGQSTTMELKYRVFDAAGNGVTPEMVLTLPDNSGLSNLDAFDWDNVNVVFNATNGTFTVSWAGYYDGSGTGVFSSGPISAANPAGGFGSGSTVDGTAGADNIGAGYVDAQGDQIDGTDGTDDVVKGGSGNDTINGVNGADTVYGEAGDDRLVLTDIQPGSASGSGAYDNFLRPDPIQLNTDNSGDQSPPKMVELADGRVLYLWSDCAQGDDNTGLKLNARIMNADGTMAGNQINLDSLWAVDGSGGYDIDNMSVNVLSNGNVLVSYLRNYAETGEDTPVFSILDPSKAGTPGFVVKANVEIPAVVDTNLESPPVTTVLADGRVLFVWSEDGLSDDTTSMDVKARIFNIDGTAATSEFQIGTKAVDGSDGYDVPTMTVTQLSGGNIVVAYERNALEAGLGTDQPIFSIIRPDGTHVATDVLMQSSDTAGVEAPPVITALPDGRFMAVWTRDGLSDNTTSMWLEGRIFNADGTAAAGEFRIGSTAVDGTDWYDTDNYTITSLGNGKVVVGYVETNATGGTDYPTFSIIDTTKNPGDVGFTVKADVQINQSAVHAWMGPPVITALGDSGNFVAVWVNGQSASNALMYRVYDSAGNPLSGEIELTDASVHGVSNADGFDWGNVQVISTSDTTFVVGWVGANDGSGTSAQTSGPISVSSIVGGGDESLIGGESAETLGDTLDATGMTQNVNVNYTANETGTITEAATGDKATFAEIEKLQLGSGNDTVSAANTTAGVNVDAGAGNDSVVGGAGSDTILGGGGNDTLRGEAIPNVDTTADDAGRVTLNFSNVRPGSETAGENCAVAGSSVIYDNVATLPGGTVVSARLVLVSKSDPALDVDLASASSSGVLLNANSVQSQLGMTATFRMEFFDKSTGLPVTIDGGVVFRDIDQENGTEFVNLAANQITGYGVAPGTSLVVSQNGGNLIAAGTQQNDPSELDAQLLVNFADRSNLTFTYTARGNNTGFDFAGSDTSSFNITNLSTPAAAGSAGDSINGGDGADLIYGYGGADTLSGDAGADTIYGGDGNDIISGGAGNDSLLGEAGDEVFTFAAGAGNDTVVGGETGETLGDKVDASAATANLTLNLNSPEAGTLTDGTNTMTFSEIEGVTLGLGNDTANGSSGNDSVAGGAGNDLLLGNGGNDTLAGGDGNDSVAGGAGNDSLMGNNGDDTLNGGTGADTLVGSTGLDFADYSGSAAPVNVDLAAATGTGGDATGDTYSGIDGLIGSAGNDTLLGYDGESLSGPDIYYNIINGGDGKDYIDGRGGADVLNGEGGDDTVLGGAGRDTISGGAGNDTVDGGTEDDSISGNAGNDSLLGGAGNDTVLGGDNNDTLNGGTGADVLQGESGDDRFVLSPTFGSDTIIGGETGETTGDTLDATELVTPVTVNLATPESGTLADPSGTVVFSEIENILLGAGNDTVNGSGGNDKVDAGLGNDSVSGGAGSDTLAGGKGDDTIDGGTGSDSVTGGEGKDSLTGDTGNDTLDGGDGADTLVGGAGSDVLIGGLNDDDFRVGAGDTALGGVGDDEFTIDAALTGATNVSIDGGEGDEESVIDPTNNPAGRLGDTLDLRGLAGVTVVYNQLDPTWNGTTSESGTATYTDTNGTPITVSFRNIENILRSADNIVDGTAGGDLMNLTSGPAGVPFIDVQGDQIDGADGLNDVIDAKGGNDTVDAGLGNDTVFAGAGDDTVFGNAGNDVLQGGQGNDTLSGGANNDTLDGGVGNDSLLGGDGADSADGGDDNDYIDTSSSAGVGLPDAQGDATPNDDKDTVVGGLGNDTILTGDDADSIDGGDGADSIEAGTDNDTVLGGAGSDTVIAGEGADSVDGGDGDDSLVGGDNLSAGIPDLTDPRPGDDKDTIRGGLGNDKIFGGDDADQLFGDEGNDSLEGGLDNDSLTGGSGDDTMLGGDGADTLLGQEGEDRLYGNEGNDSLTGGAGNDSIVGGEGNDTAQGGADADTMTGDAGDDLLSGEDGTDKIYGGAGNDTLDGGNEADSLTGDAGNDRLLGGAGADTINGGDNNDTILGGSGADSMTGDAGDDRFVLEAGFGADTIVGGETGEVAGGDTLDASGLTGPTTLTLTTPESGTLSDGTATLNFAEIEGIALGSGNDTVNGSTGNDTVGGGAGNDSLNGGNGNDSLGGGDGSDTLVGGNGNDTLLGGADDDDFVLGAGDNANGGAGDDEFRFDPAVTGTGAVTVLGGETVEEGVIDPTNNPSGRIGDVLDLRGLTNATVVYNQLDPTWNGTTSESGVATYLDALGATVTVNFSEIEKVLTSPNAIVDGTAGNDLMTPTSGAGGLPYTDTQGDQIDGTDGVNDTIMGYGGNDTVDAGDGKDSVNGGTGNDSLFGNAGNDTIDGSEGDDRIDGGANDDSLIGGQGNDTVLGGLGADTIDGGTGADSLSGDDANDILAGGAGSDTLEGGQGDDILDGGDDADKLLGGDGNDRLNGEAGTDTLVGGEGNDTLSGGAGADTMSGEGGDDNFVIAPTPSNDTVLGGETNEVRGDTLDASTMVAPVTVVMSGPEAGTLADGTSTVAFSEIENILLGAGSDTATGGTGNENIDGGAGNDSLKGAAGNDTLAGGTGNDTLEGGADNDSLSGGEGNDSIVGGTGNDALQGEGGDDTFLVEPGFGNDTVVGGETGEVVGDTLDARPLSENVNVVLTAPETGTLTGPSGTIGFSQIENILLGSGNDTVAGSAGNDTVDAGGGNDTMDGGAGNDSLIAGQGNDTVAGGLGNDTVDGGAGNDLLKGGEGNDSLLGGGQDDTFLIEPGFGNDTVVGGETGEVVGDTIDARPLTESVSVNLTAPETGTLTGPSGTVTFAEIENILLGAGNDTVQGSAGNDSVDGGIGNDTIDGGAGNDTLAGGNGNDTVDGGIGDDAVTGGVGNDTVKGGDGNDTVTGDAGNDSLEGGAGNDSVDGGTGSDTLKGGEGSDTLNGGADDDDITVGAGDQASGGDGDDEFTIDKTLTGTAAITITGGEAQEELVNDPTNNPLNRIGDVLDLRGLTGVGITYNQLDPTWNGMTSESGTATYLNAAGDTVTVNFSQIEQVLSDLPPPPPPPVPDGIVNGTSGNDNMPVGYIDAQGDQIDGTDGVNDNIVAGDGNDTIDAGLGNDSVNAGKGDDLVAAGLGNDQVYGGDGADAISGNDGDDVLMGEAGNDTITGGEGSDQIYGGLDDDLLGGSDGDDTLKGESGNDTLVGGVGDDSLEGGAGSDSLEGGTGSDTLDGGANDDDIKVGAGDKATGGDGDDEFTVDPALTGTAAITIVGGEGDEEAVIESTNNPGGRIGDVLDLRGLTGVAVVYNQLDPTWNGTTSESGTATYLNGTGHPVTINFSEIENVLTNPDGIVNGTAGNDAMPIGYTDTQGDQIDGTDGLNDNILAGAGNDTINAGEGNDTVDAGTGDDKVDAGNGNDTVTAGDGNDTVDGGVGNDTVDGGKGDDSLIGNDGNDSLSGGDGIDTLKGGVGNDTLDGGADNDSLVGGNGRDSAIGGDGDDYINTRNDFALPDVGFPGFGVIPAIPADTDPNDDKDTVLGGDGNDTILTGDDADLIEGGKGADTIDAGMDNDTVSGGEDNDTIVGGEGRDVINGDDGDDLIDGGDPTVPQGDIADVDGDPLTGNNSDTLLGGKGNDTIRGGDDSDLLNGNDGNDSLDGGVDNDTLFGGLDQDTLVGGQGNDSLNGEEGNDLLQGGDGRDTLAGGTGTDTLTGGTGADVFVADGVSPDLITDFDPLTGIQGTPGATDTDNDFVNLSSFYNAGTLAAWNAAHPGQTFTNAVAWMRADQADDGILQGAGGLKIQNGGVAVDASLLNGENTSVVCFVRGTRIMTAEGEREIETLTAGDLVLTMDHGYQPIRWIGSSVVEAKGKLAPVVFEAGVLGNARALKVSPQHRMLLSGWQAELLYDEAEVLAAAKMLVNDQTIRREEGGEVEYFHMLFDAHEIVYAEGTPSESFHPGQQGWGALAEDAREEILALFPMLEGDDFAAYGPSVRRSLKANEAKLAVELLVKPAEG